MSVEMGNFVVQTFLVQRVKGKVTVDSGDSSLNNFDYKNLDTGIDHLQFTTPRFR
jgi:hypothetical protein